VGRPGVREEGNVRDGVSATGNSLLARLAVPDADRVSLDSNLAAEGASVAGHFHLLDLWEGLNICSRLSHSWILVETHLLSEGSTITGTVLSGDADLLGSLGHFGGWFEDWVLTRGSPALSRDAGFD
jgi:hypothetical protein